MIVALSAGSDRALVDVDAGGRLASLVAGSRERLVDRPQRNHRFPAISWGSFLMAPWVGRVAEGRLDWRGRSVEVVPNEGRHALHGALFDMPWQVDGCDEGSVELSRAIDPGRWPFGGRARQRLALSAGSLVFEATIIAAQPMPAALGWHPWFRRESGEDLELALQAARRLELDREMIPSGRSVPVDGEYDLRGGPALGDRRLDDVFIDAVGPAVVRWPDLELRMEFAAPLISVVVFSPAGALCVEPATAWPDALRLSAAGVAGTGQAVLEAGEQLTATMAWRW